MNFNKKTFSNILVKIKNSYGSINKMSEGTGVTSAYISKLIRLMYQKAPSPKILKKIADNSNNIISYYELLVICGYIDDKLFLDDSSEFIKNTINSKSDILFNIPIISKISLGNSIIEDEYLEGYLPLDPNIYDMDVPDDYFYLKITDESINLKVHNGDYILIHIQNFVENNDIVVAVIDETEVVIRKYKKINNEIAILEALSSYQINPIKVNLDDTKNFKIIGKAIGQFGKF